MTEDGDSRGSYPYVLLDFSEMRSLYYEEVQDSMLHYDARLIGQSPDRSTYIFDEAGVRVEVYTKTTQGVPYFTFEILYPDGAKSRYQTLDSVVRVQYSGPLPGKGPWLDVIGDIMAACSKLQFFSSVQGDAMPRMYSDTEWEADFRAAMRPNGIIPWKAGPEEFYLECETHACHGALPHELPREGHYDVLSYIHVKRGFDATLYGLQYDQKWDSNLVAGEKHLKSLVAYASTWAHS